MNGSISMFWDDPPLRCFFPYFWWLKLRFSFDIVRGQIRYSWWGRQWSKGKAPIESENHILPLIDLFDCVLLYLVGVHSSLVISSLHIILWSSFSSICWSRVFPYYLVEKYWKILGYFIFAGSQNMQQFEFKTFENNSLQIPVSPSVLSKGPQKQKYQSCNSCEVPVHHSHQKHQLTF